MSRCPVLIVIFIAILCITTADLFSAKAANQTNQENHLITDVIPIKDAQLPLDDDYPIYNSGELDNYMNLGLRSIPCEPGVECIQIGHTWYELLHNSRMGRTVAIGSDNRIHFLWHARLEQSGSRWVQYASWFDGVLSGPDTVSTADGRFVSIDVAGDRAAGTWHDSPDGVEPTWTRVARQDSSGSSNFTRLYAPKSPLYQDLSGPVGDPPIHTGSDPSEGVFIWPIIDIDISSGGDTIVHVVSHESSPASEGLGGVKTLVYFRGSGSPFTIWDDTSGVFVDSVYNITGIVNADPNSDKVAIIYLKPKLYGDDGNQYNHNVVYHESSNNGITWGGINYVTNHTGEDLERPYSEVTALYDHDGYLNICWTSPMYDSAEGTISTQQAKLYYWSERFNQKTLLYNANNLQNCLPGGWMRNISKVALTECQTSFAGEPGYSDDGLMLHISYSGFFGDTSGVPYPEDCSVSGYSNGDIYMQSSSTNGLSWGPPINLTNTQTPDCVAGECSSENWSSSAMYCTDSLRFLYIYDLDPGRSNSFEGSVQDCPVVFMTTPCYEMEELKELVVTPINFCYPFNTSPNNDTDTSFVLYSASNVSVNYTITKPAWVTLSPAGPGTIEPSIGNEIIFTLTATGPSTEGFYQGEIIFNYDGTSGPETETITIDLYNFNDFYAPEDVSIRTIVSRLAVSQTRIAHQIEGSALSYFDPPNNLIDMLSDGSLIISYNNENHYSIFFDDNYCAIPMVENQLFYALSETFVDSTSFSSYQYASGSATTGDSLIMYDVEYFAPKHPDSADFYILHFIIKAGPSFVDPITDVNIAYAADIDVPDDDAGTDNYSGFDMINQFVWQKGSPLGSAEDNDGKAVALGFYGGYSCAFSASNPGGTVIDNSTWVYPHSNYPQDSLQTLLDTLASWNNFTDSVTDCNSIISIVQNQMINTNPFDFCIIVAGRVGFGDPVPELTATIAKAKIFTNNHIDCGPCLVGDADGSYAHDISDAVYIISYIFSGGPAPTPNPLDSGDADCSGGVDISDAVYLINFIFGGGPTPGDPDDNGTPNCVCDG